MPIRNPPTQLTSRVASGKPLHRALSQMPASQRSNAPSVAPRATMAIFSPVSVEAIAPGSWRRRFGRREGVAGDDAPTGQRRVVGNAGVDPSRTRWRRLLLPERRLGLQVVHQEFTRLKGLAAMRRGDRDKDDLRL